MVDRDIVAKIEGYLDFDEDVKWTGKCSYNYINRLGLIALLGWISFFLMIYALWPGFIRDNADVVFVIFFPNFVGFIYWTVSARFETYALTNKRLFIVRNLIASHMSIKCINGGTRIHTPEWLGPNSVLVHTLKKGMSFSGFYFSWDPFVVNGVDNMEDFIDLLYDVIDETSDDIGE